MGRIKRGGYIFETWVGDHLPPHVHVWKDRKLIAKVEIGDKLYVMKGRINKRIRVILKMLINEGILK